MGIVLFIHLVSSAQIKNFYGPIRAIRGHAATNGPIILHYSFIRNGIDRRHLARI